MEVKTHGGKRKNAGRPKEAGSKLVRIPNELLPLVLQLKKFRSDHRYEPEFYNELAARIKQKIEHRDCSLIDFL